MSGQARSGQVRSQDTQTQGRRWLVTSPRYQELTERMYPRKTPDRDQDGGGERRRREWKSEGKEARQGVDEGKDTERERGVLRGRFEGEDGKEGRRRGIKRTDEGKGKSGNKG